jgi:hypothetical protein
MNIKKSLNCNCLPTEEKMSCQSLNNWFIKRRRNAEIAFLIKSPPAGRAVVCLWIQNDFFRIRNLSSHSGFLSESYSKPRPTLKTKQINIFKCNNKEERRFKFFLRNTGIRIICYELDFTNLEKSRKARIRFRDPQH